MRDTACRSGQVPADHEGIIKRFEQAWLGTTRPDLAGYLPTAGPANPRLLVELVHIDLDFRLRRGESARVEDYLQRYPVLAGDRAVLLELLAAEYVLRCCWQTGPAPEEYLQRFPGYSHELAAQLAAETSCFARPHPVGVDAPVA